MSEEIQSGNSSDSADINVNSDITNKDEQKTFKLFSKLEILITLYIFDCIIHFIVCVKKQETIRVFTKCLLMPLLLSVYIGITPKKRQSKSFITGILCGAIGDIVLLCPDTSMLNVLGSFFFAIGHFFYMIAIARRIGAKEFNKNFIFFIIFLSFILANFYFQYTHFLKKWVVGVVFSISCIIYFIVICLINTFSILLFFFKKSLSSFLICAGTLIFWYSDFTIVEVMFAKEEIYLGRLRIMTTYVIAQTCITIGISRQIQ